jgi:hypothetical protein
MVRIVNGPSLARSFALIVFSGVNRRRDLGTSTEAHLQTMLHQWKSGVQKESRCFGLTNAAPSSIVNYIPSTMLASCEKAHAPMLRAALVV